MDSLINDFESLYIQRDNELKDAKLKIYELEKTIKKLQLSITCSNTSKNGYKEEDKVCDDLNTNHLLKREIEKFIQHTFDTCSRVKGNNKIDIRSKDLKFSAQIKKFKMNQFQQLDRHWINDIIKYIPNLRPIENMIKNLCEIPLLDDNYVDKSKDRIKLSLDNYSKEDLSNFIKILNDNKKKILEYAFYGIDKKHKPLYLICIEYVNDNRDKLIIYKIIDIIKYLEKQDFIIRKSKTVFSLDDCLSFQRKGGDGGKSGSNQLQIKIVISKLKIDDRLVYSFKDL